MTYVNIPMSQQAPPDRVEIPSIAAPGRSVFFNHLVLGIKKQDHPRDSSGGPAVFLVQNLFRSGLRVGFRSHRSVRQPSRCRPMADRSWLKIPW